MKVKRRSICETCRKRKISCDGKQPACTQCMLRCLACPGYPSDWTFVTQNGARAGAMKRDNLVPRLPHTQLQHGTTAAAGRTVSRPLPTPLEHLITYIVRSYVPDPDKGRLCVNDAVNPRVCGAWVEVLPELAVNEKNAALASSISAFAVTLMSGGPARLFSLSSAFEKCSVALRSLRIEIRSVHCSPSARGEIAAAIMCLLLAELFLPTTLESWVAHLGGFAQSVQTAPPEFFASGILHKLFVGARPILTVLGFIVRKASFLERDEWRRIPFCETPPSPLQDLMGEGLAIPAILESIDKAATLPRQAGATVAKDAIRRLLSTLDSLKRWGDAFHIRHGRSPLFGTRLIEGAEGEWPQLWYQSITDANIATHYWAFRAICLASVEQLAAAYPGANFDPKSLLLCIQEPSSFLEMKQLSTWICQSIRYLMQEEMKLFGPSSILLPLRVAYDVFLAGGEYTKKELAWSRTILTDTVTNGYRFVPNFFDPWDVNC